MRSVVAAILVVAAADAMACSGSHGETDAGAADTGPSSDTGGPPDGGPLGDAGPEAVCRPPADCGVEEVVAGMAHTCARLATGTVACWGSNRNFQLAREGLDGSTWPLGVAGLPELSRFFRGNIYTCGMASSGAIWCWGDGTEAMFDETGGPSSGWITGVSDIVDLARGIAHTCALQTTGRVWCWGFRNDDGELGVGTRDVHGEPVMVEGLDGVVELALGSWHSCARTSSGRVACWGRNREGQVGDGTGGTGDFMTDALSPVFVLDGARRLTAGEDFTCALRGAGEVLCWGDNSWGRLGIGSLAEVVASPQAVVLVGGIEIADIAAGATHACALERTGRVLCWGSNGGGALGYGAPGGQTSEPVEAAGIDDATAIAVGEAHTCAIRGDGELWCWGLNDEGQVGDGTTENRSLPVRVVGLR